MDNKFNIVIDDNMSFDSVIEASAKESDNGIEVISSVLSEQRIEAFESPADITEIKLDFEKYDDPIEIIPEEPEVLHEKLPFPDSVATSVGSKIVFFDKTRSFPARVKYGAVWANVIELPSDNKAIDDYIKKGYMENPDGSLNQDIAIPIDTAELPDGTLCGVISMDISGYKRGFSNLIESGASVRACIETLAKFAGVMACLESNECYNVDWRGDKFYFNADYESFCFTFDGAGFAADGFSDAEKAKSNRIIAASIVYSLTGAVPSVDGIRYDAPGTELEEETIRFDADAPHGEASSAYSQILWDALPEKLRKSLCDCFAGQEISAKQWEDTLRDIASNTEEEACFHCDKQVLLGTQVCPYCGKSLKKDQLVSKWVISDASSLMKLGIALPVNVILDKVTVSSSLPKGDLLRMGVHNRDNLLVLQNLSGDVLTADYGELGIVDVKPHGIFLAQKGMKITVSRSLGAEMTCMGFEMKDSWEAE